MKKEEVKTDTDTNAEEKNDVFDQCKKTIQNILKTGDDGMKLELTKPKESQLDELSEKGNMVLCSLAGFSALCKAHGVPFNEKKVLHLVLESIYHAGRKILICPD